MSNTPTFGKKGHRAYVGGNWNTIGPLQFNFLKDQGLYPHHRLLDIGCGALRGGVHFINYLYPRRYCGVDIECELLTLGRKVELGEEVYQEKEPILICNGDFNFWGVPWKAEYALAQSLFTHLTMSDIKKCLKNLSTVIKPDGKFFATFYQCEKPHRNFRKSHAQKPFWFTVDQMAHAAALTGWKVDLIGKWGHPKDQRMLLFTPCP